MRALLIAVVLALSGCFRVPDVERLQEKQEQIKNLKRQIDNLRRNCPRDA